MIEKWSKYLRWVLPALFMVYYGSVLLFLHVHVENGVTIVHSHPFQNGEQGHQHGSLSEIQLYHLLSTVQVQDGAVHPWVLPFLAFQVIYTIVIRPVSPDPLFPCLGRHLLRAPPMGD
ncbi:MAG: hypothetical protein ACI30I_11420 [Parabacteroides sp.]